EQLTDFCKPCWGRSTAACWTECCRAPLLRPWPMPIRSFGLNYRHSNSGVSRRRMHGASGSRSSRSLGRTVHTLWPGWTEVHELLQAWLPQTEAFVLKGAGHGLQIVEPKSMAIGLRDFFERHPLRERA